nr:ABC transporter substrate-binding protein [Klebsiella pneumoniae subsp. pneumoniae]
MRDDVAFSNGEPFNAQAAAANFQAVLANRQRHAWLELANQITDVRALSATELQITLKAPTPLLQELALPRPFRFIAPRSLSMAAPPGIKAPIGTGPWRLASSQLNQRDVLVRNERYWGRKPALQQITIKVILTPPAGRWRSKPEKSICSTAMKGCCRWTPSNAFAITPATWLVCPPRRRR